MIPVEQIGVLLFMFGISCICAGLFHLIFGGCRRPPAHSLGLYIVFGTIFMCVGFILMNGDILSSMGIV